MSKSLEQYQKDIEEALGKLSFEEIWELSTGKKQSNKIHSSEAYYWLVMHIDKYEDDILTKTDDALRVLLLAFDATMPQGLDFFLEQLVHENESHRYWAVNALHKINSREARKAVWHIRQTHELETHEETAKFRTMLDEVFGWESRSQR